MAIGTTSQVNPDQSNFNSGKFETAGLFDGLGGWIGGPIGGSLGEWLSEHLSPQGSKLSPNQLQGASEQGSGALLDEIEKQVLPKLKGEQKSQGEGYFRIQREALSKLVGQGKWEDVEAVLKGILSELAAQGLIEGRHIDPLVNAAVRHDQSAARPTPPSTQPPRPQPRPNPEPSTAPPETIPQPSFQKPSEGIASQADLKFEQSTNRGQYEYLVADIQTSYQQLLDKVKNFYLTASGGKAGLVATQLAAGDLQTAYEELQGLASELTSKDGLINRLRAAGQHDLVNKAQQWANALNHLLGNNDAVGLQELIAQANQAVQDIGQGEPPIAVNQPQAAGWATRCHEELTNDLTAIGKARTEAQTALNLPFTASPEKKPDFDPQRTGQNDEIRRARENEQLTPEEKAKKAVEEARQIQERIDRRIQEARRTNLTRPQKEIEDEIYQQELANASPEAAAIVNVNRQRNSIPPGSIDTPPPDPAREYRELSEVEQQEYESVAPPSYRGEDVFNEQQRLRREGRPTTAADAAASLIIGTLDPAMPPEQRLEALRALGRMPAHQLAALLERNDVYDLVIRTFEEALSPAVNRLSRADLYEPSAELQAYWEPIAALMRVMPFERFWVNTVEHAVEHGGSAACDPLLVAFAFTPYDESHSWLQHITADGFDMWRMYSEIEFLSIPGARNLMVLPEMLPLPLPEISAGSSGYRQLNIAMHTVEVVRDWIWNEFRIKSDSELMTLARAMLGSAPFMPEQQGYDPVQARTVWIPEARQRIEELISSKQRATDQRAQTLYNGIMDYLTLAEALTYYPHALETNIGPEYTMSTPLILETTPGTNIVWSDILIYNNLNYLINNTNEIVPADLQPRVFDAIMRRRPGAEQFLRPLQ